jgi:plasmid stabilization system protein ParE
MVRVYFKVTKALPDLLEGSRFRHGNYLILFRIVGESVRVERVIHGARKLANAALEPEE